MSTARLTVVRDRGKCYHWGMRRDRDWLFLLSLVALVIAVSHWFTEPQRDAGVQKARSAKTNTKAERDAKQCMQNLLVMKQSIVLCYYASNSYPHRLPRSLAGVAPWGAVPTCPSAGRDTYSATYSWGQDQFGGLAFTLYCSGHHHASAGLPKDCPRVVSNEPFGSSFRVWDGCSSLFW